MLDYKNDPLTPSQGALNESTRWRKLINFYKLINDAKEEIIFIYDFFIR